MEREAVSPGSRLVVVIIAILLAASLVAYVGYNAVAMVWSYDWLDKCGSHAEWSKAQTEDSGLLHPSWSFAPVGIRCTWYIGEEVQHEEVISPW